MGWWWKSAVIGVRIAERVSAAEKRNGKEEVAPKRSKNL
jgi:hypothetical protein